MKLPGLPEGVAAVGWAKDGVPEGAFYMAGGMPGLICQYTKRAIGAFTPGAPHALIVQPENGWTFELTEHGWQARRN